MKTPRQIAIADHLWEAFARMAEEMGSDRDVLVNQAMHAFARRNGYVVAGPERSSDVRPPSLPDRPDPSDRHAVAERVLETAERLERAMQERTPSEPIAAPPAPPLPTPPRAPGGAAALFLVREDGGEAEVAKDRWVIGRGRHCDLVVDGAKVSREHAAVFREADGSWWIEDLGSSNGTWHRRERITRRRIQDGDEYFICSERIRCVVR